MKAPADTYAAFLLIGYWAPFDFTADRQLIKRGWAHFFGVPFASFYVGNEFNSLRHLLLRIILFIPLGILILRFTWLATGSSVARRFLAFSGLCGMLALAMLEELGQLAIPGRIAKFTEVCLHWTGGILGMLIAWPFLRLSAMPSKVSRRS